ncbi:MAG: hypothetical protein J7647_27520 [Cyanobacteria bacterium SBLK]|nr:hypothetical protein [Cyanobacteria bacterium SBLK]
MLIPEGQKYKFIKGLQPIYLLLFKENPAIALNLLTRGQKSAILRHIPTDFILSTSPGCLGFDASEVRFWTLLRDGRQWQHHKQKLLESGFARTYFLSQLGRFCLSDRILWLPEYEEKSLAIGEIEFQ